MTDVGKRNIKKEEVNVSFLSKDPSATAVNK